MQHQFVIKHRRKKYIKSEKASKLPFPIVKFFLQTGVKFALAKHLIKRKTFLS